MRSDDGVAQCRAHVDRLEELREVALAGKDAAGFERAELMLSLWRRLLALLEQIEHTLVITRNH